MSAAPGRTANPGRMMREQLFGTSCRTPQMAAAAALDQRRGGGMSYDWQSQVPKREEGESVERYNARLRFLMRISDWSDPEYLQVLRNAMLSEPDSDETRNRPER